MFLLELINYIGVLLFTFIIIAILFYNYIFKPFKPALLLIDNEQDVAIRAQDIGASLFSKIGRLIEVQSELIKRKDLQYQQQIYLASYITQIIQSRSEILTEDIDDFLEELTKYKFSSIEECKTTHFNKKLNGQDIKQFLIRNEQDIKTLLNTFRLAVEEVKICERENIDIYILLLSNDIPTEIIKKIPSNHLSLNNIESNIVNVYTGLFSHLIQEILSFEDDNRKLLEVNIGENNKLSFVFSQVEEDMEENPKLNFILSRMWGMLNNIKVKINPYNDNSLLITCEFMNS